MWRPTNSTQLDKFIQIQKWAIKWVFNETYHRYSNDEYLRKLKQLDVLPINLKFDFNDLVIFHKIFYDIYPLQLPQYIVKNETGHNSEHFQRQTRTYNDDDTLKVKCTIIPRINAFKNSFFVRSSTLLNSLPLEVRLDSNPESFKSSLITHLWKQLDIT